MSDVNTSTAPTAIGGGINLNSTDLAKADKRLLWVDAMRGFSIILVVLGHVLLCMGIGGERTVISSLLMAFRMPLFFFVSGFFSYRINSWWTKSRLTDIFSRKFTAQILSTIIFFSIFEYLFTSRVSFDNGFNYYWFTIALFQMYVMYVAVSLIDRLLKTDKALIFMMIIAAAAAIINFRLPNCYIAKLLAWSNVTHYLQFFTLGLICSRYRDKFFSLLSSNRFITILIIGLLSCLLFWPVKSLEASCLPLYYLIRYEISKYLALLVVILMFYSIASYWNKDTGFTRFMTYVGQRTLDIYYIHFFFLPKLNFLQEYLISDNLFVIQLLVSSIITGIVLIMSLLVSSIIRKSSTLRTFCFGVRPAVTRG